MRRLLIVAAVLLAGGTAVFAVVQMRAKNAAEAREQSEQQAAAPIPVLVATAKARDVPIILRGLGTVQAYNTPSRAALKARSRKSISRKGRRSIPATF